MTASKTVSDILEESEKFKIDKIEKKINSKVNRILLSNGEVTGLSDYLRDSRNYLEMVAPTSGSLELVTIAFKPTKLKQTVEAYVHSKPVGVLSDFDPDKSEARSILGGSKLYYDIQTTETVVMRSDTVLPFSGEMFLGVMGVKKEELFMVGEPVKVTYAPRISDRFFNARVVGYRDTVKHLNLFTSQSWLDITSKKALEMGPPTEFIELLEHLIPLSADRDFVIHWLYRSLVARARTFLILCGDPGVGKTTLKEVFKGLHGPENTGDGKKSTISGQFNSQLARGTLLWFDELKYGEGDENFMKEMPNDTMAIEFKGQDINTSTDIHNSYIISNNKPRDNYIAMDSRKFCPVKITKTRLDKIWSTGKIDNFKAKFNPKDKRYSEEYIAQIGYWIFKEGPKHAGKYINDEYESPKLYELRHTSLSKWKKRLVDVLNLMDDRGTDLREVQKIASDTFEKQPISKFTYQYLDSWWSKYNSKVKSNLTLPEESTVEAFLTVYKNLEGKKICEVEEVAGDIIFRKLGQSSKPHDFEEETDFDNFDDIARPANKVDSSDNYNDIL
jgi:energy-coupling factor transporter ATP-binding protein EcfA2